LTERWVVTHNTTVDKSTGNLNVTSNGRPRDIIQFRPRDESGLSFAAQEAIAGFRLRYSGVGLYPRTAFLADRGEHEKTANPLFHEIKRVFGKSLLFVENPLEF
jgi:hypothetical protein